MNARANKQKGSSRATVAASADRKGRQMCRTIYAAMRRALTPAPPLPPAAAARYRTHSRAAAAAIGVPTASRVRASRDFDDRRRARVPAVNSSRRSQQTAGLTRPKHVIFVTSYLPFRRADGQFCTGRSTGRQSRQVSNCCAKDRPPGGAHSTDAPCLYTRDVGGRRRWGINLSRTHSGVVIAVVDDRRWFSSTARRWQKTREPLTRPPTDG